MQPKTDFIFLDYCFLFFKLLTLKITTGFKKYVQWGFSEEDQKTTRKKGEVVL